MIESANFPFCKADFFDRFEVGKTILHIWFLRETDERVEPLLDPKKTKRKCLVRDQVVGIYAGRRDELIDIQSSHEQIKVISASAIRGLKTIEFESLRRIGDEMSITSTILRGHRGDPLAFVSVVNDLRAMLEDHSILRR